MSYEINPVTGLPIVKSPTKIDSTKQESGFDLFGNAELGNIVTSSSNNQEVFNMKNPLEATNFDPSGDLEQIAAINQGTLEKWRNGIVKGVATAGGAAVEGLLAIPAGIVNVAYQGVKNGEVKFSDFFNTPIGKGFDMMNEGAREMFPNRYTREEQSADAISFKNIVSANFWGDKVLNGAAYMAGTIATMATTGGLGSVTASIKGAKNLLNTLKYAKATGKSTKALDEIAEIAAKGALSETAAVGASRELTKGLAKNARYTEGAKYLDRIFTMAIAEANVEGRATIEEVYTNELNRYMSENNLMSEYDVPDNIRAMMMDNALKAGNLNWALNTAIVGISDAVGIGKYLGPKFSTAAKEQAVVNKIFAKGSKEATQDVSKLVGVDKIKSQLSKVELQSPSKFKRFIDKAVDFGTTPIAEAAQEGLQFISNEFASNLYASKYNESGSESLNTMMEALSTTLHSAQDKEFKESLLLGFIIGAGGRVVQGKGKNSTAINENAVKYLQNNLAIAQIDGKSKEDFRAMVNVMKEDLKNKNYSAEELVNMHNKFEDLNALSYHSAMMELALEKSSDTNLSQRERDSAKREYLDHRDNLFLLTVLRAAENNALDGYRKQIAEFENLDDASFREVLGLSENEDVSNKRELVNEMLQKTENYESIIADVDMAFRAEESRGVFKFFVDKAKEESDLKEIHNKKRLLTNLLLTNQNTDERIIDILSSLKKKFNILVDEDKETFAQDAQDQLDNLKQKEEDDFVDKFFKGEFKSGNKEIDDKINEVLEELRKNPLYVTTTKEGEAKEKLEARNEFLREDLLKVALAFKQLSEMKLPAKELKEAAIMLRDYQYLALRRAAVSETLNDLRGKEAKKTIDKFNYIERYIEAKKREALIDDLKTFNNYLENTSSSSVVSNILKRVVGLEKEKLPFLFEEGEVFESTVYELETENVTLFNEKGEVSKTITSEELEELRKNNNFNEAKVQLHKEEIKQAEEAIKQIDEALKTVAKNKERAEKLNAQRKTFLSSKESNEAEIKKLNKEIKEFELIDKAFKDGKVEDADGKSLATKNKNNARYVHREGNYDVVTNVENANDSYRITMINGVPTLVSKIEKNSEGKNVEKAITPKSINKIIDVQKVRAAKSYAKLNEALKLVEFIDIAATMKDIMNQISINKRKLQSLNKKLKSKEVNVKLIEQLNEVKANLNLLYNQLDAVKRLKASYEKDIIPFIAEEIQIVKEIIGGLEINTPVIDKVIEEGRQGFKAVKDKIESMISKYAIDLENLEKIQGISIDYFDSLTTSLEKGIIDTSNLINEIKDLTFTENVSFEEMNKVTDSYQRVIDAVLRNNAIAKTALNLESKINEDLRNLLEVYKNQSDIASEEKTKKDFKRKIRSANSIMGNTETDTLQVAEDNKSEYEKDRSEHGPKRDFKTSFAAIRYRHQLSDGRLTEEPSQLRFGKVMQMIPESELSQYKFEMTVIEDENRFGYKLPDSITSEDVLKANIEGRLVKVTPSGTKYVNFVEGKGIELSDDFNSDTAVYSSLQTLQDASANKDRISFEKYISVSNDKIVISDYEGLRKELSKGFSGIDEELTDKRIEIEIQNLYNNRKAAIEGFISKSPLLKSFQLSEGISIPGIKSKIRDVISDVKVQAKTTKKGKKLVAYVTDKFGNSFSLNNRKLNKTEAETIYNLWKDWFQHQESDNDGPLYIITDVSKGATLEEQSFVGTITYNKARFITLKSLANKTATYEQIVAAANKLKAAMKKKNPKAKVEYIDYLINNYLEKGKSYSFNESGSIRVDDAYQKGFFEKFTTITLADYIKDLTHRNSKVGKISVDTKTDSITLEIDKTKIEIKDEKDLINKKADIINFLQNKFHNISKTKLSNNEAHYEIIYNDSGMEVIKHNTYQDYLIGAKEDKRGVDDLPTTIDYLGQDPTKSASLTLLQKYPVISGESVTVNKTDIKRTSVDESNIDDDKKTSENKAELNDIDFLKSLTFQKENTSKKPDEINDEDLEYIKSLLKKQSSIIQTSLFKTANNIPLNSSEIQALVEAVEKGNLDSSILSRKCKL